MKPISRLPVLFAVATAVSATPVGAAKKPWDIERYRECAAVRPTDELDTNVTISSLNCKKSSQADVRGVSMSDLQVDPFFLSMRPKAEQSWTHSLVLNVTYSRVNNIFADGGYSPARFKDVVFLVGGEQVSKSFDLAQIDSRSCETYRAFGTSSTNCPFGERLVVSFSQEQVALLRSAVTADPKAQLRLRASAETGERFDVSVDLLELEAVVGKADIN
jgi:hypothetical protein